MKNKYFIVITVITVLCVIIGTMYHVAGAGIFNRKGTAKRIEIGEVSVDGQSMEGSTEQVLEAFDSIRIDAEVLDLRIEEGEACHIEYECTKGLEPICEVKDGVLYVKQNPRRTWNFFGTGNNKASLCVTIPQGTAMGKINIELDVGNIELEGLEAARCDVEASVGNIEISSCTFDASGFDSDTGNITIEDTALGNASCSSDVGNVKLKDCTFGDLKIETAIGDTKVVAAQKLADYDIDLEIDFGNVSVNGRREGTRYSSKGTGGSRMEISSDMGDISVTYEE